MPHTQGKVLLQFGATWCQPCKSFAPIAKEIAEKAGLKFIKYDVEENVDMANLYAVKGVPCSLVINDGQELGRFQGSSPGTLRQLVRTCFL